MAFDVALRNPGTTFSIDLGGGPPPPTEEIEDFESGSNGASYTTSSGLAIGGSGTGTALYSSSAAAEGSLGVDLLSVTGATLIVREYDVSNASASELYCHCAIKLSAFPGAVTTIAQIRDITAPIVVLRLNTDGTVSIRDNNTVRGTSTTVLSSTTWVQIGWGFSGGQVLMRLYGEDGELLESEISGTYSASTVPVLLYQGWQTNPSVASSTMSLDYLGYNTGDWIDPLVMSAPPTIGYFGIPMA